MPEPSLDLTTPTRVHIVGAGGAGMSAIALVLAQMNHVVSGSDLRESANLERIALAGVTTHVGHDPANVADGTDAVVVSSAVRDSNPEVGAARQRGIPVLRRAQMLAAITATRRSIAVAGTHGKTTTSSMLALALRSAGLRPSFIIGGELNEVGTNAAWDTGEWLVVEADESDGTFLELDAFAGIVTSVEADHLDHYRGFDGLIDAFRSFVTGIAGPVVICVDDPRAGDLVSEAHRPLTYGESNAADYRVTNLELGRAGSAFDLECDGRSLGRVELAVPGRHNALNAAAAAAMAVELDADFDAVRAAFAAFGGVARRFQFRGARDGVTFVDDYAHLPSEVAAAISAARDGDWNRVIVVFQPHRYSRTEALGAEFAGAFAGASQVVVTDIYPAGETPRPGVSSRLVVDAIRRADPQLPVEFVPTRQDLADLPERLCSQGDLVLTLGAGDLTTLPDEWLRADR